MVLIVQGMRKWSKKVPTAIFKALSLAHTKSMHSCGWTTMSHAFVTSTRVKIPLDHLAIPRSK